jgi:hypothetical protein
VGAWGAGRGPEVVNTRTLGAATVAAAAVQSHLAEGTEAPRAREVLDAIWPRVLEHAAEALRRELAVGAEVSQKLARLLDETTKRRTEDVPARQTGAARPSPA